MSPKLKITLSSISLILLLTSCAYTSATNEPSSSGSAAPVSNGSAQVRVTVQKSEGKDTCQADYSAAPAGPVTFTVVNKDVPAVTEVELLNDKRILGERENVIPGLKEAGFTVTLNGGNYEIYCPGANPEKQKFTVTGQAKTAASSTSEQLKEGTDGYAKYVNIQTESLVAVVAELKASVDSGDIMASQQAYAKARPFYERIEPVAASFRDLDPAIDARVDKVAAGEEWLGFHPIERDVFESRTITESTRNLAAGLMENVTKLRDLSKDLSYKPEDLANGASSLLEEVQSTKITGEEERYSKLDFVDFNANVEGSRQAFEYLKPALEKINAELTSTITGKFDEVQQVLEKYKDPNALGGFVPYDDARKASEGPGLTALIQSLQEPLSKISERVATEG